VENCFCKHAGDIFRITGFLNCFPKNYKDNVLETGFVSIVR
jgi:hypothetical protein